MKKLLFLSAILIAVIMSACSSEDYKSYVPADSKVVAKLDFKEFIAQTGIDQEKLFKDIVEQYGDDVADFKNSMEVGDVVVIEKNIKSIDAIGIITGDYVYDETNAYTLIDKNDNTLKIKLANNDVTNRAVAYKVKIKATKDAPKYEVKEGENLEYTINKDESATFRIDADYSLFETDGKVFVDDVLVNKDNYVSKTGSTIITLAKSYMDTLSTGTHTLKVTFNNGGTSETTFTVAKQEEKNPQTSDNIISYISILGLSIISITGLYINKKKFN